MRRAAWIFFASIFLPSLGLAWLAIHSVRDQQVVLEHQQAIICQNITDALAKNVQGQMDSVRADFVKTTQQLEGSAASPQALAQNFNRTLREAWPLAEIGFAVNLDGEIYSPKPYDGPEARTFRDENDRFLSNRENVEVYSSNSVANSMTANQSGGMMQNAASQLALKLPNTVGNASAEKQKIAGNVVADLPLQPQALDALQKKSDERRPDAAKDEDLKNNETTKSLATIDAQKTQEALRSESGAARLSPAAPQPASAGNAPADTDQNFDKAASEQAPAAPAAAASATRSASIDASSASNGQMITTPTAPASAPTSSDAITAAPAPATLENEEAFTPPQAKPTTNTPPPATATVAAPEGGASLYNAAAPVFAKIARQVVPQQMLARDDAPLSNTVPEASDFRRVIGTEPSGELARFLEDKMRLLVWSHPSIDAPIVFGAQLELTRLTESLRGSFQIPELAEASFSRTGSGTFCVAILDDTGRPVAVSRPNFTADWKHPFVATEIGEVLPHWEAALYLVDPHQISRAAQTLQITFLLIVALLVTAILVGGTIIAQDVRREMRLAQQKTDFVSNVSHELKTPLTSIRMFADLLAEKRVPDEERQATYLRIIAAEASRLTRLINNVLDFARMEKGKPHGQHDACDLTDAVRDVAGTCAPHLEAAGIAFQCEIEAETLPIRGDRDELAQIILNLISNAEKYGGNDILVRVRRQDTAAGALGCVDVLDRGAGIPARQVKTVFEPFHRLDDSLSSGIPGSGLGLTLARRMARAHGGDVTYSARAGGGSCFTLAVPLETK